MLKGTVLLFILLAVVGGELAVRRAWQYINGRAGNITS